MREPEVYSFTSPSPFCTWNIRLWSTHEGST